MFHLLINWNNCYCIERVKTRTSSFIRKQLGITLCIVDSVTFWAVHSPVRKISNNNIRQTKSNYKSFWSIEPRDLFHWIANPDYTCVQRIIGDHFDNFYFIFKEPFSHYLYFTYCLPLHMHTMTTAYIRDLCTSEASWKQLLKTDKNYKKIIFEWCGRS